MSDDTWIFVLMCSCASDIDFFHPQAIYFVSNNAVEFKYNASLFFISSSFSPQKKREKFDDFFFPVGK